METDWPRQRRAIARDAIGVGIAVGMFGLSFGALSIASGLTIWQTIVLSSVMFTGGSQFAFIGVIGSGGSALAAAIAALLLGARNTIYGVTMSAMLRPRGWRRLLAAHVTIDESTAMALAQADPAEPRAARTAFWATGIAVFIGWNLATIAGALGAASLGDPAKWGLDAMVPAAFLALLWPRLRSRLTIAVAVAAAVVAIGTSFLVPPGLPVLLGGAVAVMIALTWRALPDTELLGAASDERPEPLGTTPGDVP